MHHTPDPIFLGTSDEFEYEESGAIPDEGAISDAVEVVVQQQDYDGYLILPQRSIFIQTIRGMNENREYVYPVAAGVRIERDYIREREVIAPEEFLILKTETTVDPSTICLSDITCCPVEDDQLGQWMWSYWMLKEDLRLVVLDEELQ